MRRISIFLALFSLAFPALALAASAGFAPGTLWLSSDTARSGDTVKLYTVVYDSTPSPLEGDVAFSIDGSSLGSAHFKLAAGETQIVSLPWTATEGSHSFTASLAHVSGVDAITTATSNSVSIEVSKPAPSVAEQYLSQANTAIGSTSPALASALSSVASTTENWRAKGTDFLSKALYTDQASTTSLKSAASSTAKGAVLGAETYRTPAAAASGNAGGFIAQAKHLLLTVLLWIFRSAYLFYPFFALLFFILLYIAKRTLSRPGS